MDCKGKRIAFTGIAANYDRSAIHQAIRSLSGTVDNSVTSRTDLLVIGEDLGNGVRKRDTAQKHGIPTMWAQEFMERQGNGPGSWPFADRSKARKSSKKPAVPKEVTNALKALSKNEAMSGFVGF